MTYLQESVFWLILFGFIGYRVVTNQNDAQAVNLIFESVVLQIRKYYHLVILHPFWFTNPVGRWWMMRKYRKMAEEMLSKIEKEKEEN